MSARGSPTCDGSSGEVDQGETEVPSSFEASDELPATPREVYEAWLSSEGMPR